MVVIFTFQYTNATFSVTESYSTFKQTLKTNVNSLQWFLSLNNALQVKAYHLLSTHWYKTGWRRWTLPHQYQILMGPPTIFWCSPQHFCFSFTNILAWPTNIFGINGTRVNVLGSFWSIHFKHYSAFISSLSRQQLFRSQYNMAYTICQKTQRNKTNMLQLSSLKLSTINLTEMSRIVNFIPFIDIFITKKPSVLAKSYYLQSDITTPIKCSTKLTSSSEQWSSYWFHCTSLYVFLNLIAVTTFISFFFQHYNGGLTDVLWKDTSP